MKIAAHSPEFARKAGIAQKVAKEFTAADKRRASATVTALRRVPK